MYYTKPDGERERERIRAVSAESAAEIFDMIDTDSTELYLEEDTNGKND
jgi:hypothetical protein